MKIAVGIQKVGKPPGRQKKIEVYRSEPCGYKQRYDAMVRVHILCLNNACCGLKGMAALMGK